MHIPFDPAIPLLGMYPRVTLGHMQNCSIVSNSKRLEATQVFHQQENDFSFSLLLQLQSGKKSEALFLRLEMSWAQSSTPFLIALDCPPVLLVFPRQQSPPKWEMASSQLENISVMRGMVRRGSNAKELHPLPVIIQELFFTG